MVLGEKIKKIREEKGMSKKELSDLSKVSLVQLNNIESGKNSPSAITMAKLYCALGCPNDFYDE